MYNLYVTVDYSRLTHFSVPGAAECSAQSSVSDSVWLKEWVWGVPLVGSGL